jgi:hypothetical protein
MTYLKPQTALGGFALLTLLLAGAAIGRSLGISSDEALYLTALALVGITWLCNRFRRREAPLPAEEPKA